MKFWLISEEDIGTIREALESKSHAAMKGYNCPDHFPPVACEGCKGQAQRNKAVHDLDTGLHTSDEQPTG